MRRGATLLPPRLMYRFMACLSKRVKVVAARLTSDGDQRFPVEGHDCLCRPIAEFGGQRNVRKVLWISRGTIQHGVQRSATHGQNAQLRNHDGETEGPPRNGCEDAGLGALPLRSA